MGNNEPVGGAGFKILAAIFLVTALGTLLFWVDWFTAGRVAISGQSCYFAFENAFPLADGILVLFLVLAACSLLRASESSLLFSFLAAGGILALACLDAAYNLRHGKYRELTGAAMGLETYINLHCLILGAATLWYVWKKRARLRSLAPGQGSSLPSNGNRYVTVLAAAFFLIAAVKFAPLAAAGDPYNHPGDRCVAVFDASFFLADLMVGLGALVSTFGLVKRAPEAVRSSLFVSGAITFLASLQALFYLENRRWASQGALTEALNVLIWYAVSACTAVAMWRHRRLLLRPAPSGSVKESMIGGTPDGK